MSKIGAGILGCLLLGWVGQAVAGDSEAYQFAGQVGTIAGIAQACGKDVTVLISRTQEAIAILALDTNDATMATSNLQKTMIIQFNTQKANHALPCDQITPDYDSLPILKDDYRTTVLPKLRINTAQAKASPPILPQTLTVVPGSLDMSNGSGSAVAGQGAVTNIYIGPPSPTGSNAVPQVSVSTNAAPNNPQVSVSAGNNPSTPPLNAVYGAPIFNNTASPSPNPFANPTATTPNPYVSAAPNPIATAAPNPYVSAKPNPIAAATPNPYASPAAVAPSPNAAPQPQANTFAQTTPTQEYQQSITR
jgi:hypothetical protein